MSEQKENSNPHGAVSQRAHQGKNLTQVGHDYIRYLQVRFSSGNWVAIVMNVAILALVGHGLTNTVQSFVELAAQMRSDNALCSAEVNRLTIELAEAVARRDGLLSEGDKAAIGDLAIAQGLISAEEDKQTLLESQKEHEIVEVQISRGGHRALGLDILSRIPKLLDLMILEMEHSIEEHNSKSVETESAEEI